MAFLGARSSSEFPPGDNVHVRYDREPKRYIIPAKLNLRRIGSIPVARSAFCCLARPCVVQGRDLAYRSVPTDSVDRMRQSGPSVEFVVDGLFRRHRTLYPAGRESQ